MPKMSYSATTVSQSIFFEDILACGDDNAMPSLEEFCSKSKE